MRGPVWWYREVRAWIRHHCRKGWRDLFKEVLRTRPFDYSYLLELERLKLIEMYTYIESNKRFVSWERPVRDMKICVSLLEILLDKRDLFHFNGKLLFVDCPDNPRHKMIKESDDFEYVCDVKVNTRNVSRFATKEEEKFLLYHKHELYIRKARYLYHKIRTEREYEWWD